MVILKKHPRLSLLALIMPIPMIVAAEMGSPGAQVVFMGSAFAVMAPMLIVRVKGELPMSEFIAIVGIMMGSWVFLVFVRATIYGFLGEPLQKSNCSTTRSNEPLPRRDFQPS